MLTPSDQNTTALTYTPHRTLAPEHFANKDIAMEILDYLLDGLIVFNHQGEITFINPEACDICDTNAQDVINKTAATIADYQTNLLAIIKALPQFESALKKPVSRVEVEFQIPFNRIIQVSLTAVWSTSKQLVAYLLILHDITREKAIDRLKSEFISVASHQLRTPLSAIKWTLQMLLDGDLGALSAEQNEFLKKCKTSNERMINLVNDLLDISRIEEGRFQYTLQNIDISDYLGNTMLEYYPQAKQKQLLLEYHNEIPGKLFVQIDPSRMNMVFQNLLENAFKYTESGGRVSVKATLTKTNVKIEIADTGVGIPQEQQTKIFQKFFRADNVVKLETEGSGLGLYLAKNIVERHHGSISFYSKELIGTTFIITLPIQQHTTI